MGCAVPMGCSPHILIEAIVGWLRWIPVAPREINPPPGVLPEPASKPTDHVWTVAELIEKASEIYGPATRFWHEIRWLPPNINDYFIMAKPTEPVALSMEQIGELNQKLSELRHDMNNSLSLIAATVALIRHRPTVTEQMWNTLTEQPRKISESFSQFTRDLEAVLHITRS